MERKPFSPLALAAFIAAFLGFMVFARAIRVALGENIPPVLLYGITAGYFLTVCILIFVWKSQAAKGTIDVINYTAFWQNAVRYTLALDMVMFGGQKFCHLQFYVPLGMLDDPFTAIPNEMLMWAFMGRYHSMVDIIASIEILGGVLLLFRKTRLVGAFVLLPMLLNIMLLDFYYLNLLVQVYVVIEVLVVIYLILLEYRRLVKFFLIDKGSSPLYNFRNKGFGYAVKASVIIIPAIALGMHKYPSNYTEIMGKYEVKRAFINNVDQSKAPCRDSVLTNIFIDHFDLVLGYPDYRNKVIGRYNYNPETKQITVKFQYPATMKDSLTAAITPGNGEMKTLAGKIGGKTFKVEMVRVAPVNN
ncbi:hypothetical protein [Mucilaginibacter psychrotolerans]|uniref:DoxX family protein n=1 Tax=Mucilaginibacter psychrotolerans TaxID=1524096 RepID=A0A4Y8SE53_9SPHI|nr:hypothetical protein [Mucilaginibacter psychrotolerans]TFF36857.1 hypothetical protein E2R66_13900 [Mucilaginibacter psychrotolerans]